MRHAIALSAAIAAAFALAGCASITKPNSPNNFQPEMTQGVNVVEIGTIVSVHTVRIAPDHEALAVGGGAVAGGAVGDKLGGTIGAVIGALGGAIGGDAEEHKLGKQQAQQLTIRLDGPAAKTAGGLVSVTQATGPKFTVGEQVELIMGARVCRDYQCTTQPTRVMPLASN